MTSWKTRIGGLHALWRIAEHSARDREAVISIAGRAVFHRADLRLSDLRSCDLSTADLLQARLTGALASDTTRWPGGFDHAAAGVVVTADPGPEPPPLLQPRRNNHAAPPLRSLQ